MRTEIISIPTPTHPWMVLTTRRMVPSRVQTGIQGFFNAWTAASAGVTNFHFF
jgi:hypothetical protein